MEEKNTGSDEGWDFKELKEIIAEIQRLVDKDNREKEEKRKKNDG